MARKVTAAPKVYCQGFTGTAGDAYSQWRALEITADVRRMHDARFTTVVLSERGVTLATRLDVFKRGKLIETHFSFAAATV